MGRSNLGTFMHSLFCINLQPGVWLESYKTLTSFRNCFASSRFFSFFSFFSTRLDFLTLAFSAIFSVVLDFSIFSSKDSSKNTCNGEASRRPISRFNSPAKSTGGSRSRQRGKEVWKHSLKFYVAALKYLYNRWTHSVTARLHKLSNQLNSLHSGLSSVLGLVFKQRLDSITSQFAVHRSKSAPKTFVVGSSR